MPRLVVRQWQTWRGAHAVIGTASRLQRLVKPSCTTTIRWSTAPSVSDSKHSAVIRPLNSAILIPASVPATQSDDLINHIIPISSEHTSKETFCIFLVTPSFASWLLKDDFFLEKAVRRVYSKTSAGHLTVQVLCAVVDKLPAGRAFKSAATVDDEVKRRSIEPPIGETGFEGIAFTTLPSTASVPSTSPQSPDKGALDFTFSGQTTKKDLHKDTWRVPLANTVFQTGTPVTMFLSTWSLYRNQKGLKLESKTDISHHGVDLTNSNESLDRPNSALTIPLLPLTFPRKVEGCMGNIIRRLVTNGESVSASSDLEKVVPQYFQSRGEPPQPTTAWALVIPETQKPMLDKIIMRILAKRIRRKEKGTEMTNILWERLWQNDPVVWNRMVATALEHGARLHRVLSGGGGWGKKAGLLSLDPVPVSEEIPIRMEDATSTFDGPGDLSTALTPVVQDGDAIQFFISPKVGTQAGVGVPEEVEKLKSLPKENAWGWELGTVPSTVDLMPGGSWQSTESGSKYVAVFKHSFGALTERGLTLTRTFPATHARLPPKIVTTMVDAPFSRFWAVDLANKQGSTTDSINDRQNNILPQTCSIRKISKEWSTPIVNLQSVEATLDRARHLEKETARLAAIYQTVMFNIRQRCRTRQSSKSLSRRARKKRQQTWTKIIFKCKQTVQKLRRELFSIVALRSTTLLSQLTQAADVHAIRVYEIHVALRLRLGKLIFRRQKKPERRARLRRLEDCLTELRRYDEVLFCESTQVSPLQVSAKLQRLEYLSFVQNHLFVNKRRFRILRHVTSLGMPLVRRSIIRRSRDKRYEDRPDYARKRLGQFELRKARMDAMREAQNRNLETRKAKKTERNKTELANIVALWLDDSTEQVNVKGRKKL